MATATLTNRTGGRSGNSSARRVPTRKRSKYQVLPPPTLEYLASLRASIIQRGVDEAIIKDENGETVDGVQRETICDELGIFCPTQVRRFASEAEKYELALTKNCVRRQLGREAKRDLIGAYLLVDAEISDTWLATIIGGISSNNVAAVREKLVRTGKIVAHRKLRGRDGKYRPHKYARIIANTPSELIVAQQAIHNLPASCDGLFLDCTTAQRAVIGTNGSSGGSHGGVTHERYTPSWIVDGARTVMGRIDLDPASSRKANTVVKAVEFFTKSDDGLSKKWGGRIFLNPPFDDWPSWMTKLDGEIKAGRVKEVLVVGPSNVSAYRPLLLRGGLLLVPDQRPKYLDPTTDTLIDPPFGSLICYLGPHKGRFAEVFGNQGMILGAIPSKKCASNAKH